MDNLQYGAGHSVNMAYLSRTKSREAPMNMITTVHLPDVQSSEDSRNVVIQRVGVKSVTYPVLVATADGVQPTIATIDMYVRLPAHAKGTHMSRFLEVMEESTAPLSAETLSTLMMTMLERLDAESGMI
jgi:GTP cyclohydrolase FolE2